MRWQIIRSRAYWQGPAAGKEAVRVLEMDNFLTTGVCPSFVGLLASESKAPFDLRNTLVN